MTARTPDAEPLLTPAEVATMFRVDPKTVTRWAKAGKLTSIRTLGGHRRYREAEVRALLAGIPQQRSEAEQPHDRAVFGPPNPIPARGAPPGSAPHHLAPLSFIRRGACPNRPHTRTIWVRHRSRWTPPGPARSFLCAREPVRAAGPVGWTPPAGAAVAGPRCSPVQSKDCRAGGAIAHIKLTGCRAAVRFPVPETRTVTPVTAREGCGADAAAIEGRNPFPPSTASHRTAGGERAVGHRAGGLWSPPPSPGAAAAADGVSREAGSVSGAASEAVDGPLEGRADVRAPESAAGAPTARLRGSMASRRRRAQTGQWRVRWR